MENYKWYTLTWIIFHKMTSKLKKPKNKDKYIEFFNLFKYIIPCNYCKNHYIDMLHSETFKINEDTLFKWTVNIHNNVNKMLNKNVWPVNKKTKDYYKNLKLPINIIDIFINLYSVHYMPDNKYVLRLRDLAKELTFSS